MLKGNVAGEFHDGKTGTGLMIRPVNTVALCATS